MDSRPLTKAQRIALEDIRDQGWANINPEIGGRATNDLVDRLEFAGLVELTGGHWTQQRLVLTKAGRAALKTVDV